MVLRMAPLIKRSGSENWYYRRTIPADVQRIIASMAGFEKPRGWYKTHIMVTTKTADRAVAKTRAADIANGALSLPFCMQPSSGRSNRRAKCLG